MLHLVELVCLDRNPDLVSVQSADGFLINPTRGWAEELKRVAVEQVELHHETGEGSR